MSGVIKGRGDEGQRGKERWRTEGGGGDRDEFTVYYTRLASVQEHFLFMLECSFLRFYSRFESL